MKPEPLKNKVLSRADLELNLIPWDIRLFRDYDIQSAVKWLEDKLNETEMITNERGGYIPNSLDLPTVLRIIDKAFPDLNTRSQTKVKKHGGAKDG